MSQEYDSGWTYVLKPCILAVGETLRSQEWYNDFLFLVGLRSGNHADSTVYEYVRGC